MRTRSSVVPRSSRRCARSSTRSIDGPAALLITGEAGIGKSIVWREGLRLARDRGCEILQCRPVESEAQLAFTALSDLLVDVSPAAFDALPDPQRRALDVALLRAEPDGDELLPRAVGLAVLGLLRERSTAAPLVIGIDDAHWLDQASRRVLAFAIRRVSREQVGLLDRVAARRRWHHPRRDRRRRRPAGHPSAGSDRSGPTHWRSCCATGSGRG